MSSVEGARSITYATGKARNSEDWMAEDSIRASGGGGDGAVLINIKQERNLGGGHNLCESIKEMRTANLNVKGSLGQEKP